MSVLESSQAGGVLTLRLNRPDALNALTQELAAALGGALRSAEQDDTVRAVVLTGNGRGFCAGADLSDIAADFAGALTPGGGMTSAAVLEAVRRHSVPLVEALLGLSKPLVAAVNGPCAGAGMGLALAADVIVAAQGATFTVVFTRRGLVPDYGVTHLLPRLVGLRKARELCLLADGVPADEALRMGLITQVAPLEELGDAALGWARRFAEGPGVALRLTKRLLAESFELDARQAVEREFAAQALCLTTADAVEGVAAFLEKRPPTFSGR